MVRAGKDISPCLWTRVIARVGSWFSWYLFHSDKVGLFQQLGCVLEGNSEVTRIILM